MRVGVKICGVSTPDALDACIEADADWVGFVFFAQSPRAVTAGRARGLIQRLPTCIGAVGLFVRPTMDEVARALDEADLAALQIYDEAARVREFRRFGLPVWHACPVQAVEQLPVQTDADRLVVEGFASGSGRPGGNGTRLDGSMLMGWNPPVGWILAGGLTPGNVGDAVRSTGAPAVDVSSGVETGPGLKDPRAILEFAKAARSQ